MQSLGKLRDDEIPGKKGVWIYKGGVVFWVDTGREAWVSTTLVEVPKGLTKDPTLEIPDRLSTFC